jgi:hypothetical protein
VSKGAGGAGGVQGSTGSVKEEGCVSLREGGGSLGGIMQYMVGRRA